jgi:hypothetical protein
LLGNDLALNYGVNVSQESLSENENNLKLLIKWMRSMATYIVDNSPK